MRSAGTFFLIIIVFIFLILSASSFLVYERIEAIKNFIDNLIASITGDIECRNCAPGQYCGGVPIRCRNKEPPGADCATDSYCQSGICVQGILKCGDANGKVPNGTFCDASANQCMSSSYCGGIPVQCRPKQAPGTDCLTDAYCQSGKCVQGILKCGDANGKVPNGTFCDASADQCMPNSYCGGVPVQCRPKQAAGTDCVTDAYCQSGKCVQGVLKCGDANGKLPDGIFCDAGSDQCQTTSYCGGIPVQCRPKGPVGSDCIADSYCQSGKCVVGIDKCGDANGKLPDGTFCDIGANQCGLNSWCGGLPVQCRPKGGNGAYCPLDSTACQTGYYCAADSKCTPLGKGGDICIDNSHCESGNCAANSHLGGRRICTWSTSGRQTYNSLSPPGSGTCVGRSGAFDSNYEAANNGQSICQRTPGYQFSGSVSNQYQFGPAGTYNNCRSNSSVPVCVNVGN